MDDVMGYFIANSRNPTVGVLAHPGQVDIRIAAKAVSKEAALELIAPVEAEVRQLIGKHIFAADEETMENVVGALLREKRQTIAVCEDLTGGMVADRLQEADADRFQEGIISNGQTALRRLLAFSRQPERVNEFWSEPQALTNELAWAVRAQAGSDLGLAVYSIPDLTDRSENLARGQTFMAITDGKGFKQRLYNMAGRGRPDRTRMSFMPWRWCGWRCWREWRKNPQGGRDHPLPLGGPNMKFLVTIDRDEEGFFVVLRKSTSECNLEN